MLLAFPYVPYTAKSQADNAKNQTRKPPLLVSLLLATSKGVRWLPFKAENQEKLKCDICTSSKDTKRIMISLLIMIMSIMIIFLQTSVENSKMANGKVKKWERGTCLLRCYVDMVVFWIRKHIGFASKHEVNSLENICVCVFLKIALERLMQEWNA